MSAKKTAFHPPFTGLLREGAPRWTRITGEVQITAEPLRVDDLLELRRDPSDPHRVDRGRTLRGLWDHLVAVMLLEFKSPVWPARRGDLARLLACGLLWLATRAEDDGASGSERLAAHEVSLALVVPSRNTALREELDDLGLRLHADPSGYHPVDGFPLRVLVVELGVVCEREDDDLLRWFAGRRLRTLDALQWVRQHQNFRRIMDPREHSDSTQATPDLYGFEDWLQSFLQELTLEQRLAGLDPAQRLAGLDPAQRLAGLDPAQRLAGLSLSEQLLALPPAVLRGFTEEYLSTLPPELQGQLRARRG